MNYQQIKSEKELTGAKATNVECETELACEVKDILSMSASASLVSAQSYEGRVDYKGRVIFNVIYLLEGEIRRKELGVEFLDYAEMAVDSGAKIKVELAVESINANRVNKLTLQTVVTAKIIAESEQVCSVLNEGDNYCVNLKEITKGELCADLSQAFTVEDQTEVSCILKNVLSSNAVASVNGCQCGIGSVIVDGEIILSLVLLPFEEKSDIIKETRIIPYRLELEGAEIEVSDASFASALVNQVSLKVFVDEQRKKTSISAEIALQLSAKAYKQKNLCYVDDTFCVDRQLSLARESLTFKNFSGQKYRNERYSGKAFCSVPTDGRLICAMEERVYGVSFSFDQDVRVEGVLSAHILFENMQSGGLCSRLAELPFSITFSEDIAVENLKCVCRGINARLRNGEVEMEGELSIWYKTSSEQSINAITAVEEGEPLQENKCAFNLYLPSKEDTMWDISKALKVPESIIVEQNQGLSFPLSGNEKIIVYSKK